MIRLATDLKHPDGYAAPWRSLCVGDSLPTHRQTLCVGEAGDSRAYASGDVGHMKQSPPKAVLQLN